MENLNFDNRIHEQNGLYCLNDIAEKLIGSTNIKEYMKKIPNKEYINGNCYITKDHMIEILLKSKADIAKKYLEYVCKKYNIKLDNNVTKEKDATKHITTTQQLQSKNANRNFIDNGSNEIIYNNKRILFFEYNKMLYFRGKDICDILEYSNCRDAINDHVNKKSIFRFDLYLGNEGNEGNERDVANGDGCHSPINISKVLKKNNTVISNIEDKEGVRHSHRLYHSPHVSTSNININDNKIYDIGEVIKTIPHTPHLQL
jgi:hypothetical protein